MSVLIAFVVLLLVLYGLSFLLAETATVILRIIKYNIVFVVLFAVSMLVFGVDETLTWVILNFPTVELFVVGMVLMDSLLKIEKATTKMAENGINYSRVVTDTSDRPVESESPSDPEVSEFISKVKSTYPKEAEKVRESIKSNSGGPSYETLLKIGIPIFVVVIFFWIGTLL